MGNVLQNDLILEPASLVQWRDLPAAVDSVSVGYRATSPDGVVTAVEGSLVSGASGAWLNADGATGWSLLMSNAAFSLAPNEFYVDQTAIPMVEAFRIFTTVADAMAAASADLSLLGNNVIIRLREGQAHTWNGAGLTAGDVQNVLVTSRGDEAASLTLTGTWVDSSTGISTSMMTFQNLEVTLGGAVDVGAYRGLMFIDATLVGAANTLSVDTGSVSLYHSSSTDVLFRSGGNIGSIGFVVSNSRLEWTNVPAGSVFVEGFWIFLATMSQIVIDASNFTAFRPASFDIFPVPPASVFLFAVNGCSLQANQSGVGSAVLIEKATSSALISEGSVVHSSSAGGTLSFGYIDSSVVGLKSFGTDMLNLPRGAWHDYDFMGTVASVGRLRFVSDPSFTTLQAGQTADVTFVLDNATTWPADGVIDIAFPVGFDISGVTVSSIVGNPVFVVGTYTTAIIGQTFRIMRDGAGGGCAPMPANTEVTIVLSGVVNPVATGNTSRFFATTYGIGVLFAGNGQLDIGNGDGVTIVP